MSCIIKKIKIIVVAVFIVLAHYSVNVKAQTDQMLHAQAEDFYQKNDYAKAYDLYQRIAQKTPSIYYNMGDCAYKLGKPGKALLYWRRAEHDWGLFGRTDLLKNIDLVKQKVSVQQQKEVASSELSYSQTVLNVLMAIKYNFFSIIKATPLLYLQLLVLALWVILFIYARYFRRKKLSILNYTLFGLLALSASMLALKYNFQVKKQLVVVSGKAPLLSGPGKNFAPMGHLPEAQEADILKESGDFYRIRVNKNTGWIDKQFVEKI